MHSWTHMRHLPTRRGKSDVIEMLYLLCKCGSVRSRDDKSILQTSM